MRKPDGGPAFPLAFVSRDGGAGAGVVNVTDGMSLRQWYAGMVLTGVNANAVLIISLKEEATKRQMTEDAMLVAYCFACADAMIAEGEK